MTTAIQSKGNIVPAEVFKPFQKQIDEFKEINEKTVFDYEDKKGNKEARSHVANLRKVKTPIKKAHKYAKAEALQLGRDLDAYKNKLVDQVEDMISVHAEPLQRIKDRKEAEEAEKKRIEQVQVDHEEALEMHDLFKREEEIKRQQAEMAAKQEEINRIELEQKLERERLEREEQIKKEAKEQAKRDAENARLENELKLEEEKNRRIREAEEAEKKRVADIAQAEKEKQDEINRLKQEMIEKEKAKHEQLEKERAIKEAREADVKHRKKINNNIVKCLVNFKIDKKVAQDIVKSVAKNEIPGLSVNY